MPRGNVHACLVPMLLVTLSVSCLVFLPQGQADSNASKPNWSCQNWDQCLNVSWAPTKPGPGNDINFSITVTTADDVLDLALLYYKYKVPYQDWSPSLDWYSLIMTNESKSMNTAAYHDMHGWIGGTRLQVWFEAYDPQHNRLKSPTYQIEVRGNDSWVCDVPDGYDDCVTTSFGYISDGWPFNVENGGEVPNYTMIYVDIASIRGIDPSKPTAIKAGIVTYWFENAGGEKINGPYTAKMETMNGQVTNMTTDKPYTSEPDQYLRFNVSAFDMYDRALISEDFVLHVNKTVARIKVPVFMNVVVRFEDGTRGKGYPLQGIEVTFTNSTGSVKVITDSEGKASYSTYQMGRDTWTMSVVYKRLLKEVRDILPNATRVRSGNYTYYITFDANETLAPTQEDVDANYFLYFGIGLAGFIAVGAPLNARYFMEKRRRDDIKRIEKEARFKI